MNDHTSVLQYLPSHAHCSKGDIENAVKFLEMYVDVSEKAGLQSSLAKACSAIGIMHNTLVSDIDIIYKQYQ